MSRNFYEDDEEDFEWPFRCSWPFKDMKVGQIVCISNPPAHAQVYVHVYASKVNKKFKTKTVDGDLFITRKL